MKSLSSMFYFSLAIVFTAPFSARAEEGEVKCNYETLLWGRLKSGSAGVTAQDRLKVLVVGQIRNGDSVWYSIMTGPRRAPELVPQGALSAPLPSGTCLKEGYMAKVASFFGGAKEELGLDRLRDGEKDPNWSDDPGIVPAKTHQFYAGSDGRRSAR